MFVQDDSEPEEDNEDDGQAAQQPSTSAKVQPNV